MQTDKVYAHNIFFKAIQPDYAAYRLYDINNRRMTAQKKPVSLLFCLLMDLAGYASFALPVLGAFSDIVWAPLSALIFYKTFGGWKGAFGAVFNFVEEILPGLDFIPSFTITWLFKNIMDRRHKSLAITASSPF